MAEMKFDITKVVDGAIKEFKHQGYNVSKDEFQTITEV